MAKLRGEEGGNEEGRPWRHVGDRVYYIEGDEFVMESDEKGDQKVDIDGVLQGSELGSVLLSEVQSHRWNRSTFQMQHVRAA